VDERIKSTYASQGAAQNQNSLYDMYVRFFRWAADRVDKDGIIAFISNRNFIEKGAFDGFRKVAGKEFSDIWLFDLGGDVRANPKISGTKHNVFGIQTGVTISFCVKRTDKRGLLIHYARRPEMETKDEKLDFLASHKIADIPFDTVQPDAKSNWINLTDNDWDSQILIADPKLKSTKKSKQHKAIFRLVSNGLKSQRDEWVYDFDKAALANKVRYLISAYEDARRKRTKEHTNLIKWDAELDRYCSSGIAKEYKGEQIVRAEYRPFIRKWLYFDRHFNGRTYQLPVMFPPGRSNKLITFSDAGFRSEYCVFTSDGPVDLHFGAAVDGYQVVSRYRYSESNERLDNITDWALGQFRNQYEKGRKPKRVIDKDAIFHYVYGVLHDPVYREKYAQNLKREFPRIPFYTDFWKWTDWGAKLMALHIDYEKVEPWPLKRVDTVDKTAKKSGVAPKVMLKALKETSAVVLDSDTQLAAVPHEAWHYRLGNRSALEWILDQYKEKTPKDPTIRERFNTYKFADHKDHVIDLLKRVTRVSIETWAITEAMQASKSSR
jgi:predicted helicase